MVESTRLELVGVFCLEGGDAPTPVAIPLGSERGGPGRVALASLIDLGFDLVPPCPTISYRHS